MLLFFQKRAPCGCSIFNNFKIYYNLIFMKIKTNQILFLLVIIFKTKILFPKPLYQGYYFIYFMNLLHLFFSILTKFLTAIVFILISKLTTGNLKADYIFYIAILRFLTFTLIDIFVHFFHINHKLLMHLLAEIFSILRLFNYFVHFSLLFKIVICTYFDIFVICLIIL